METEVSYQSVLGGMSARELRLRTIQQSVGLLESLGLCYFMANLS